MIQEQALAEWKQRIQHKLHREDTIMENTNMSSTDRLLLIQLERIYPELRTGTRVKIEAWYLAAKAGVSSSAVTKFLAAMYKGGYFAYNSVLKTALNHGQFKYSRESYVQELEQCRYPEHINTRDTPQRHQERKKALQRVTCRFCKSENIMYKVIPVCRDCGKEQEDV